MQHELMQAEFMENFTNIYFGTATTLDTILHQKKIFMDTIAANKPIHLISNKVKLIDTTAMQLLLAFIKCAKAANLPVIWENVSPEILEAASLLGLSANLDLVSIKG